MSPTSRPFASRFTALQDPATRTVGVTSSSRSTTLTLCGMVISAPRMFSSVNRLLSTAGNCSGLQPMGTTTAFTPTDSK
jgi:hypothetical protein